MARHFRPMTCLMIALLAVAGTATAAASVGGTLSGSATVGDATANAHAGGHVGLADDGTATADLGADAAATAADHAAGLALDSDGDVGANVDDHHASASVDAEGRSATVTVDGTTVSTDDVNAELPALPELPEPSGEVSVVATLTAAVSGAGGWMASLGATLAALFRF